MAETIPQHVNSASKELRFRAYAILNHPNEGRLAGKVNGFLLLLILANIAAIILDSVQSVHVKYGFLLNWFEMISVSVFAVEYAARLWTAKCIPRYNHRFGMLRYALTPLALLDLIAILPFFLPMVLPLDLRFLRVVRLFRLSGMLKMVRYAHSLRMITDVLKEKREELAVTFAFLIAILLAASTLVFYAEHAAQPDKFTDIPAALWWGIVTLTTVGYGDIFPVTALGKIIAGIISILGIGLFALPAGVISAGIIEHIQKKKAKAKCPHCGKEL